MTPPGSSVDAPTAPDTMIAPEVTAPEVTADVNANVTVRPNRGDDTTGAASPRTHSVRQFSIFGLSSTALLVLGAALLVGIIPAIVAMTRTRGTTYIDNNNNRAVAPATTVMAQPGGSPANPETSASKRATDVPAARHDAAFNRAAPTDVLATSPHTATDDGTRIFGMRPLIAAMVGAAGLLGIILAIGVSMHRRRVKRIEWFAA